MIVKTSIKSCCGSSVQLFILDKPLRKFQIKIFEEAGWLLPKNFLDSGIMYASKNQVIINGSFGGTKFNVRGNDPQTLSELEQLLEKAILLK